jgi:DNA adenine methylase
MTSLFPYMGGKHKLAREIAPHLHARGDTVLVEIFGGSAAVMLNAGFDKRVYNDADDSMVNVFRVIADAGQCAELVRLLSVMPPARTIFNDCAHPPKGTPVERAAKTIYRQMFCFGGKGRSGGFSVSIGDRPAIKEVLRYRGLIARLDRFIDFFHSTMIECLDYQEVVRIYGHKDNVVLFADPPYVGTEAYYRAGSFSEWDHWNLEQMLSSARAHAVVTYYDCETIRNLYSPDRWTFHAVKGSKNNSRGRCRSSESTELILVKRTS